MAGKPTSWSDSALAAALQVAEGATAGAVDPAAAAIAAVLPGGAKGSSMWGAGNSFGSAYQRNLAVAQKLQAARKTENPRASMAGGIVGAVASPLNKVFAPVKGAGMALNAARMAGQGGLYGLIHGASSAPAGSSAADVVTHAGIEGAKQAVAAPVLGGLLHGATQIGGRAFRRTASAVTDASGALTTAAQTALDRSKVPVQAITPDFLAEWAGIAKTKGVSPASLHEALLKHVGVDAPTRGMVLGEKPSIAALDAPSVVANAKPAVRASLAARAPAAEEAPLGRNFVETALKAKQAAPEAYRKAASNEGAFHPDTVGSFSDISAKNLQEAGPGLPTSAAELLDNRRMPLTNAFINGARGVPKLIDRLSTMASITPSVEDLGGALQNRTNAPGGLTMDGLENLRRDVSSAMAEAMEKKGHGDDVTGLRTILKSLDDWQEANLGNFSGDGKKAMADLAAARKAHADFVKTYAGNPNPAVRNAWNHAKPFIEGADASTAVHDAPAGLTDTVEQTLKKGVVNPGTLNPVAGGAKTPSGVQTYTALTSPGPQGGVPPLDEGGEDALHNALRSDLLGAEHTSASAGEVVGSPFAHVLAPGDAEALAQHGAANDILGVKSPRPSSLDATPSPVREATKLLVRGVVGGAGGLAANHLTGGLLSPTTAGAAGVGVGELAGNAVGKAMAAKNAAANATAEMAGAPTEFLPTDPNGVAMNLAAPALAGVRATEAPPPTAEEVKKTGNPVTLDQLPEHPDAPKDDTREGLITLDQLPEKPGKPAPRASGGRTAFRAGGATQHKSIEPLVQRLLHRAKKARGDTLKSTEGLLKHDDSAIVAALDTAKRAI